LTAALQPRFVSAFGPSSPRLRRRSAHVATPGMLGLAEGSVLPSDLEFGAHLNPLPILDRVARRRTADEDVEQIRLLRSSCSSQVLATTASTSLSALCASRPSLGRRRVTSKAFATVDPPRSEFLDRVGFSWDGLLTLRCSLGKRCVQISISLRLSLVLFP
jgi:hypothetical protein